MVTNSSIEEQSGINRISFELRRRRWNWIGHVLRRDATNHARVAIEWAPEGRRNVGRPKETWRRTVTKEMKSYGWKSWNDVKVVASDRRKWKESVLALCDSCYREEK